MPRAKFSPRARILKRNIRFGNGRSCGVSSGTSGSFTWGELTFRCGTVSSAQEYASISPSPDSLSLSVSLHKLRRFAALPLPVGFVENFLAQANALRGGLDQLVFLDVFQRL